jgi:hypothetical protein
VDELAAAAHCEGAVTTFVNNAACAESLVRDRARTVPSTAFIGNLSVSAADALGGDDSFRTDQGR